MDKGTCNQSPPGQDSHHFVVDPPTPHEKDFGVKQTANLLLTVNTHCIWCGKKVKCRGWIHE